MKDKNTHGSRPPLSRGLREFLLEKGQRYNSIEEMPEHLQESFRAIIERYDLRGEPGLEKFLKKKPARKP
jgi:hypothetical protein